MTFQKKICISPNFRGKGGREGSVFCPNFKVQNQYECQVCITRISHRKMGKPNQISERYRHNLPCTLQELRRSKNTLHMQHGLQSMFSSAQSRNAGVRKNPPPPPPLFPNRTCIIIQCYVNSCEMHTMNSPAWARL